MLVVGLTGNFGMGKSTVLSFFGELGAATVESDAAVRELLGEDKVIKSVREIFGSEVIGPDGGIDRKAVSSRIFGDPGSRKALEALIHPMVFDKVDKYLSAVKDEVEIAVVEIPLLFEGDYRKRFDRVVTVFTDEKTAVERLSASGVAEKEAKARMMAQLPICSKVDLADYIIDNSGTKEETKKQVEEVYQKLLEEARNAS